MTLVLEFKPTNPELAQWVLVEEFGNGRKQVLDVFPTEEEARLAAVEYGEPYVRRSPCPKP